MLLIIKFFNYIYNLYIFQKINKKTVIPVKNVPVAIPNECSKKPINFSLYIKSVNN